MPSKKNANDKASPGKVQVPRDGKDPNKAEIDRLTDVIQELTKKTPVQVAPHLKKAAPYLATAIVYITLAIPHVIKAAGIVQAQVSKLPEEIIRAALGFVVCFFGGIFPATIAAVEAWRLCGGDEAWEYAKQLFQEFQKVQVANAEDEKKDDDKDGVADAKQLQAKDLILRKMAVAAAAVEPEVLSKATFGIYTGWIGVLAILKIEFARTITLGERIGEQVYMPVSTRVEPALAEAVPDDLKKWVPVAVRVGCKFLAMVAAWWCTRIISAFHSAIRGGRIFGECLAKVLHDKGVLKEEQANLDEYIGWAVAAAGFLFQFSVGFSAPFPFWLVLWPLQLVETFITWSV